MLYVLRERERVCVCCVCVCVCVGERERASSSSFLSLSQSPSLLQQKERETRESAMTIAVLCSFGIVAAVWQSMREREREWIDSLLSLFLFTLLKRVTSDNKKRERERE